MFRSSLVHCIANNVNSHISHCISRIRSMDARDKFKGLKVLRFSVEQYRWYWNESNKGKWYKLFTIQFSFLYTETLDVFHSPQLWITAIILVLCKNTQEGNWFIETINLIGTFPMGSTMWKIAINFIAYIDGVYMILMIQSILSYNLFAYPFYNYFY